MHLLEQQLKTLGSSFMIHEFINFLALYKNKQVIYNICKSELK